MPDSLFQCLESGSVLLKVHYRQIDQTFIERVFFTFAGNQFVSASAEGDTDEIALGTDSPTKDSDDVSGRSPWVAAIGKPLLWAWSLRNQQGYCDGVQLEFRTTVSDSGPILQLATRASCLRVFSLTEAK